jgi:Flp pilus assembly protein TadD
VVTVGWFWYLITLIPVIGIVQVGSQGMADRYTYVPLIGVFIAATWLVADGFGRAQARFSTFLLSNAAGAALATVLLIGLAVTSHYQVGYWRNTTTLARHAASVTENNHYAHAVLGFALLKAGKTEEALEHCVEAVRLEPAFSEGHYRLGLVLAEKGLMTGAVTHLRMALRADPDNPDIYNDLGCALGRIGQPEEAIEAFATALRLRPDHDAAARNLKATRSATDTPGRLE